MGSSLNLFLAIIAGFSVGCLFTTLASIYIYGSQQEKIGQRAENRHMVINTIGKLCAAVENAFSAYRIGTVKYESLREILLSKIDEINTILTSNIDILDSFYIKNIERFIIDQKCFLMHGESDKPLSATGEAVREVSRTSLATDGVDLQEPSLPSYTPSGANIEKEEVSLEDDLQKPDDMAVAEKPLDTGKAGPFVSVDKDEHDFHSEALSAFESGATTRIPIESIKKYQEPEESVSLEKLQAQGTAFDSETAQKDDTIPSFTRKTVEDDHPIKGTPVFDTSFDIAATHEYKVGDLVDETGSKMPLTEAKEEELTQHDALTESPTQKSVEDDEIFEVDIPKKSSSKKVSPPGKKTIEDDTLITGNDVIDQMDNFFGFDNK